MDSIAADCFDTSSPSWRNINLNMLEPVSCAPFHVATPFPPEQLRAGDIVLFSQQVGFYDQNSPHGKEDKTRFSRVQSLSWQRYLSQAYARLSFLDLGNALVEQSS
jgi:hypothetical protein